MTPRDRILGLLMHSGRWLAAWEIGGVTHIGTWRLYPHLHRLEQEGLIESRWESGLPSRTRIYHLTPESTRDNAAGPDDQSY